MATRTALYIRCSSRDQVKHGFSIPDQLARLRAEAKSAGELVVAEFIDQARSGASAAKREEFQKLLAAAHRREFDRVRVESVDRGHRNDMERRQFEEELQVLGIQVHYVGEPEKQAPQYRKLQRGIKGVLAEWEVDETSQRTYKRHRSLAQLGRWRGGNPPYGLRPDGHGWFDSDREYYPILCWILERRAEGSGHHSIAKMLNRGIRVEGSEPFVPPTPGLLQYRKQPFLIRQDPETGDEIHIPKRMPDGSWKPQTIAHICQAAVDGIYAGIYKWGRTTNRFTEDEHGYTKQVVRIDTGKPLIDQDLLRRVQAVELTNMADVILPTVKNSYLLSHLVRCGHCGRSVPGYTTSKYKIVRGEKVKYRYRKYRCQGRTNRPGGCQMTILSAEALELVVLKAVFGETARIAPRSLVKTLSAAVERRRREILSALEVLIEQRRELEAHRDTALDSLLKDRSLSDMLRKAVAERAEAAVGALTELEGKERTLRAGITALESQARSVERILTHPDLDPARWEEPAVNLALQRALHVMVRRIEVSRQSKGRYSVKIWLSDAESLLFSESVMSESTCTISFTKTTIPRRYVPWQEVAA